MIGINTILCGWNHIAHVTTKKTELEFYVFRMVSVLFIGLTCTFSDMFESVIPWPLLSSKCICITSYDVMERCVAEKVHPRSMYYAST